MAFRIFSRNVRPWNGSRAFGLPIRSDLPAARTIAEIICAGDCGLLTSFPALSRADRDRGLATCRKAGSKTVREEQERQSERTLCATTSLQGARFRMRQSFDAPHKNRWAPASPRYTEIRNRRCGGSAAWLLY